MFNYVVFKIKAVPWLSAAHVILVVAVHTKDLGRAKSASANTANCPETNLVSRKILVGLPSKHTVYGPVLLFAGSSRR